MALDQEHSSGFSLNVVPSSGVRSPLVLIANSFTMGVETDVLAVRLVLGLRYVLVLMRIVSTDSRFVSHPPFIHAVYEARCHHPRLCPGL